MRYWTNVYPVYLVSSHFSTPCHVSGFKKRDIGSSKLHSFHFPKNLHRRDDNLSHKFSLHFWLLLLLLPPGWRSRPACGSDHRKLWILRTVPYGEIFRSRPPATSHPPATLKWHLTLSCVYIRPWKWKIVMSHSGCVFTLRSHARKEISHGLLKVARWGRIAAAHQSCSDLPLRGRIYLVSSPLQRPLTNTKQPL